MRRLVVAFRSTTPVPAIPTTLDTRGAIRPTPSVEVAVTSHLRSQSSTFITAPDIHHINTPTLHTHTKHGTTKTITHLGVIRVIQQLTPRVASTPRQARPSNPRQPPHPLIQQALRLTIITQVRLHLRHMGFLGLTLGPNLQ